MSAMDSTSSECENTDLQATVIEFTPGLTPNRVVNHSVDYPISTEQSTVTEVTPVTPTVGGHPMSTVARPVDPSQSSDNDTPIVSNASTPPSTTATPSSTILTSSLSKYLVLYVAPLPEKRAATSARVTGARVLTSSEGYEILRKKEERKGRKRKKKERKP